jgi:hypothetical protein
VRHPRPRRKRRSFEANPHPPFSITFELRGYHGIDTFTLDATFRIYHDVDTLTMRVE